MQSNEKSIVHLLRMLCVQINYKVTKSQFTSSQGRELHAQVWSDFHYIGTGVVVTLM